MSLSLAATGTVSYGNVTFDGYIRSTVSCVPEKDNAGRVVKWVKQTYTIIGYVNSSNGTDETMELRRQNLLSPGLEFKFQEKGFGDIHVNGSSSVRDVNWGPWPELLSWVPLGNDQTALVEWRVTVHIPECDSARTRGIVESSFSVDFDIDKHGYTSRAIQGTLVIAQTRRDGRAAETADTFWDLINFPIPIGFQRVVNRRTNTPDKSRLNYTLVDKELPPHPLPSGVTEISCRHSARGSWKDGFAKWDVNLSANITLPPTTPKSASWEVFKFIAGRTFADTIAAQGNDPAGVFKTVLLGTLQVLGVVGQKPYIGLTDLEVEDDKFGVGSSFSATYLMLGATLKTFLAASGMWKTLKDTDFAKWKTSLAATAQHPRGEAKLVLPPGEVLISLCDNQTNKESTLSPRKGGRVAAGKEERIETDKIPRASSWYYYRSYLRLVVESRVAVHVPLPTEDPDRYAVSASRATDPIQAHSEQFSTIDPKSLDAVSIPAPPRDNTIQVLGSPVVWLELSGQALRLGHKVSIPRIVRVGAIAPVQVHADILEGEGAAIAGLPLHGARWKIRYALPRQIVGQFPTLANPLFGIDGGMGANPLAP